MSKCQHEIDAVKRIRGRHATVPQRKLADWIVEGRGPFFSSRYIPEFNDQDMEDLCRMKCGLSYATVYNRIRRIDGSIK